MTKNKIKLLVLPALMLGMATVLVLLANWPAQANSVGSFAGGNRGFAPSVAGTVHPLAADNSGTLVRPPAISAFAPASAPATGSSALLNTRHRFALGMIETANNDGEIGGAGEVSRYQIMPSVWKHYSDSRSYRNPEVSLEVAQQHWTALHAFFKQQTRREPTDFDIVCPLEHALRLLRQQGIQSRPPEPGGARPRPTLREPHPAKRILIGQETARGRRGRSRP